MDVKDEEILYAVRDQDFVSVSRELKTNPKSINVVDISGRTPLITASQNKDLNSVRVLLDKGADYQIKDNNGRNALDYAILNKDYDIIRVLLNALPNVSAQKLTLKKSEAEKLSKDAKLMRLLKYPSKPIPSRFTIKQAIKFLLTIKEALTIPPGFLKILETEFGKESINKFLDFLLQHCNLNHFFPKTVFITAGSYGAAFQLCITDHCDPPLALKLVPFLTKMDYSNLPVENPYRPENVEWLVLKQINAVFSKLDFPHVPLAYNSFICQNADSTPLRKFISKFIDEAEIRKIYANAWFRITFMEYAESGSLDKFLKVKGNRDRNLKHIIFQAILIMAILHSKLPGFRHNDYHMGNLLIRPNRGYVYSKLKNHGFLIRNPEVLVLINDFDFAFIKPSISNAKYDSFYQKYIPDPSPYTDMFKFFNHLLSTMGSDIDKDAYNFAKYVIPYHELIGHTVLDGKRTVVSYYGLDLPVKEFEKFLREKGMYYDIKERYPERLLDHPYFDEFRE